MNLIPIPVKNKHPMMIQSDNIVALLYLGFYVPLIEQERCHD